MLPAASTDAAFVATLRCGCISLLNHDYLKIVGIVATTIAVAATMKKAFKLSFGIFLLIGGWIITDWYWPVKSSIRQFDANAVAELDTKMWRSYYAKEPVKMFFQFAGLLRKQFHAPFWRSNVIAYYGGKAAFVFKKGKNRNDYEKALPYLIKYYTQLHRLSQEDFNIKQAAKTELEWWIVHRDKQQYNYSDLQKALQSNAAAIFCFPDTTFKEYAVYRTKAMFIRDEKGVHGSATEEDWKNIEEELKHSWNELHKVVTN